MDGPFLLSPLAEAFFLGWSTRIVSHVEEKQEQYRLFFSVTPSSCLPRFPSFLFFSFLSQVLRWLKNAPCSFSSHSKKRKKKVQNAFSCFLPSFQLLRSFWFPFAPFGFLLFLCN
jgi:hypothetical protein